jgi:hypothetical protein
VTSKVALAEATWNEELCSVIADVCDERRVGYVCIEYGTTGLRRTLEVEVIRTRAQMVVVEHCKLRGEHLVYCSDGQTCST